MPLQLKYLNKWSEDASCLPISYLMSAGETVSYTTRGIIKMNMYLAFNIAFVLVGITTDYCRLLVSFALLYLMILCVILLKLLVLIIDCIRSSHSSCRDVAQFQTLGEILTWKGQNLDQIGWTVGWKKA